MARLRMTTARSDESGAGSAGRGPLRVLVCGHRSFAASGLVERLRSRGHKAWGFTRGPVGIDGFEVTGPVAQLHENPHLPGPIDVVVNYILLKDQVIPRNLAFLDSLLEFCRTRSVRHLAHISSISSVRATVKLVTEASPTEPNPHRKGSYGSLKVATDLHLLEKAPPTLALSMLRPGFILGAGVPDPIVGMAARLPNNMLLVLGQARNVVPVTTREIVSEAVMRIVELEPPKDRRFYLLADTNSPTRLEWLRGCCTLLGAGTGVVRVPVFLWLTAAAGGAVVAGALRMGIRPWKIIRGVCRTQRFDSGVTARTLGMDLSVDWRREMVGSMENQAVDWAAPHRPAEPHPIAARRINILGFGGIVRQKHLPALKRLGFGGALEAWDLRGGTDPKTGQKLHAIGQRPLGDADLHIVASPGPAHREAIPLLRPVAGPILVEKPVAHSEEELNEWLALDAARGGRVFVLHNYRFKRNVSAMLGYLSRFNPGRLHHVDLVFQSPSVNKDTEWRRAERRARTLLMDYALHFVDLACMFNAGAWRVERARRERNRLDQTSLIEGTLRSSTYGVSFLLRQGFMPRRCRLFYTFENYGVSLAFFPDTFVPHQTFDSWTLHRWEARRNFRATIAKVSDKLLGRDRDNSHAWAIAGALGQEELASSIALVKLAAFYRMAYQLIGAVYDDEDLGKPGARGPGP